MELKQIELFVLKVMQHFPFFFQAWNDADSLLFPPNEVLATDGAVPLTNSLSEAEQPRIEHALCQACEGPSKSKTDTVPFKHGNQAWR